MATKNNSKKVQSNELAIIFKEDKAQYRKYDSVIKKGVTSINKSTLDIACAIFQIHSLKLFKVEGFKNIYDYCSAKYALSRGHVNNCVQIVARFANQIKDGETFRMEIDERYKDYSITKLIVMRPFTDEQLTKIKPEMSVRLIQKTLEKYREVSPDDSDTNTDTDAEAGNTAINGEQTELFGDENTDDSALNEVVINNVFTFNNLYILGANMESEEKAKESILDQFRETMDVVYKLVTNGHCVRIVEEPTFEGV